MKTIGILCSLIVALCVGPACSPDGLPGIVANSTTRPASADCLPGERGYLRASLRGAIDTEIDWRGSTLQCEGGARPDNRGLRVSFLGPPDALGRQLRLVFGIAAIPGSNASKSPTNITVIVEGQHQLYATQGDDKCMVESLVQEPIAERRQSITLYRVAARGYCIDPAATLDGSGRLYINRFDFAGVARFEDNELRTNSARTYAPGTQWHHSTASYGKYRSI